MLFGLSFSGCLLYGLCFNGLRFSGFYAPVVVLVRQGVGCFCRCGSIVFIAFVSQLVVEIGLPLRIVKWRVCYFLCVWLFFKQSFSN